MKVATSKKYESPTFENGLVKLTPKQGSAPEYVAKCKYVDREQDLVWIMDGPTQERVLTHSSKRKSQLSASL